MLTRPRAPAGAPILWVLLLALALAGVLAYQAADAARSHRRATEEALRDYAAFAAWELGRGLASAVAGSLSPAVVRARMVTELQQAPAEEALEGFARLVEQGIAQGCECPGAVHDYFTLDLARGAVTAAPERLEETHRRWLEASLLPRLRDSAAALRYSRETLEVEGARANGRIVTEQILTERIVRAPGADSAKLRQVVLAPPPTPFALAPLPHRPGSAVVYTLLPDAGGRLTRVFGFVLDVAAFARPVVREVVAGAPLLPPSLLGGAGNDQVLSLSVRTPGGDSLYRSAGAAAAVGVVEDTVAVGVGEVVIRAAVRPEMAGRLVIGGLPRSRLPLLLGVFTLTLALLGVAIRQLLRQQDLIRLRSDFVSGVSHELRTPLAQIRLFSDLLDSGRLQEAQRQRSIRIIGEEARRLTFLVENVLQFSRSERKLGRVSPEPMEVAPLVREIVESFAPLARARRVTLLTRLDGDAVAPVDPDALRQVLLNLLDNAVKYGPAGQRVTVGVESGPERVRVRVDDEGPGIPPGERERIWEPYRRLPRDVESATGGSGIGLAVVRELVELHGGRVAATDAPGGGARFLVELPRRPARGAEAPGGEREETERPSVSGVSG